MKKILTKPSLYSLLWCLYYMQGSFYPEGGIISRGILAIFLLWSMFLFVKVYDYEDRPQMIKNLQNLAILFAIYGLIRLVVNTNGWLAVSDSTTYFKEHELSLLPVFAMYYFSREKMINADWFYRIFFLFFITAIVAFVFMSMRMRVRFDADEVTNNSGYFVASLIPLLVFLRKKPLLQYGALMIILFFVIEGMKRGAIIAAGISSCYFIVESIRDSSGQKKIAFVMLGFLLIIATVYYFRDSLSSSLYMQDRLQRTMNGDMSNRENMYPEYIHFFFNNANPIQFLFGFGADGTLKYLDGYAHQDWIEILIDEGLVGFCFLLAFWISTIKLFFKTRGLSNGNISAIIGLFTCLFFIKSMVSMSINGFTLFSTSALAFALAGLSDAQIQEELSNL